VACLALLGDRPPSAAAGGFSITRLPNNCWKVRERLVVARHERDRVVL
jgi:hypothetical protein